MRRRHARSHSFDKFAAVVVSSRSLKLLQERRVTPLSRRPDIEQMLDA